jgi:hypothetical protein
MTTHGENIGSRKVEPETHELPKWRLYANFLLRELARLWYGKKSIFNIRHGHGEGSAFWLNFVAIFTDMSFLFGEEHGAPPDETCSRLVNAICDWEKWHGTYLTFSEPYYEALWKAHKALGNEIAKKLINDFDVGVILSFVAYACTFASKGKFPPYAFFARLKPLEYYEALPVDPGLEDKYYNDKPSLF